MPQVGYAGATGSVLDVDRAAKLGDAWAWQPKIDGMYCTVDTDERGEIVRMRSRVGGYVALGDFAGVRTLPNARLIAELEAHTEASVAVVASRGHRLLHVFDCERVSGVDLAGAPYATRYAQLVGEASKLEQSMADALYAAGRRRGNRGRFVDAAPLDVRRTPIVPMLRGRSGLQSLWREHVELGGGEGLVAVRLDAPLGGKASKRKIKPIDTATGVVVARDSGAAVVRVRDRDVVVSAPPWVAAGAKVDVAHNGYFADGLPRFARIVRPRYDLMPSTVDAPATIQ